MANDINSVVLVGNLTRDCGSNERDFAYTQGGMAIATISIASNRSRKMPDGSWQDEASFFDVKLFGKTAENLKPYLTKGQKIAVDGVLKQERWQDKQTGNNMSKVVILANGVQLLGGRKEQQAETWQQGQQQYQQQKQAQQQQYVQQGYVQPETRPAQAFAPVTNADGFVEDIPF